MASKHDYPLITYRLLIDATDVPDVICYLHLERWIIASLMLGVTMQFILGRALS